MEYPKGAAIAKHTHPGEEVGYVLQGTMQIDIEGKPPMRERPEMQNLKLDPDGLRL